MVQSQVVNGLFSACGSTMAGLPGPSQSARSERDEEEGLCKPFFAGSSHLPWDYRLHEKRAFFSLHDPPCLHAKLASIVVLCGNHGQSNFPTLYDASDKKARTKYLWQEFFSDPSQWWDNRLTKKSLRQPDFKHKTTLEALWIDSWLNPPWVKEKFATVDFDQLKSCGRSPTRVHFSFGNYDEIQKLACMGRLKEALHLFELMALQTSETPQAAFVCLLRECTRRKALAEGRQVHALLVKTKRVANVFLSNLLIGMYSNCGSIAEALEVFTAMPQRNVFSWTAMISAHAKNKQCKEAVALFQQMHQVGIEPDEVACVVALKACTNIAALEDGQQLHLLILKRGFDSNVIIQTTLIDMYAKCGCLKDARELFDNMSERDVVSWNTMITGYAQRGFGREALDLYEQMRLEGLEPSDVTLLLLLKACASTSALEQGMQLHSLIREKGLESEMNIQSTLVDMYAKCGSLKDARELFNKMTKRDVVSWNAMIAAYGEKGFGMEALNLYEQMKHERVEPDNLTVLLLLKACASISALEQGKQLHSLILEKGLDSDLAIQTTLVDMYAKCGCLKVARELFDNMTERNVVSWNAMIAGYGRKGLGKEALDLFEQMKREGFQADAITYICILNACSHSGLVDEGRYVFESMSKDHSVTPTHDHYACMVDLLGRAGCISDAEDLILKMPIQPNQVVWMSLLGAARKYVDVEIGRRAFERIVKMKAGTAASYLLLQDIYSAAGRMTEMNAKI